MKRKMILLLLVTTSTAMGAAAQTWNEFFKQKKTQRKYLIEQIAALNTYAAFLKKGYEIAGSGMDLVGKFTGEESLLHKGFFTSLKAVNPVVRSNVNAAEMLANQAAIMRNMFAAGRAKYLNRSESDHISKVRNHLLRECEQDMEEFLMLITASEMELSDDERMVRLEKVQRSMLDKFRFSRSFTSDFRLLSIQRQREQNDLEKTAKLYDVFQSPQP